MRGWEDGITMEFRIELSTAFLLEPELDKKWERQRGKRHVTFSSKGKVLSLWATECFPLRVQKKQICFLKCTQVRLKGTKRPLFQRQLDPHPALIVDYPFGVPVLGFLQIKISLKKMRESVLYWFIRPLYHFYALSPAQSMSLTFCKSSQWVSVMPTISYFFLWVKILDSLLFSVRYLHK